MVATASTTLRRQQRRRRTGPLPARRKRGGDADDDVDPLESEGWEPDEEDLVEEEDLGDLDVDELDLDDVENSVTGNEDDYIDDDEIEYEDEEEEEDDDDAGFDEDDGIEEEDDFDDDEEDDDEEDYDIEGIDDLNELLESTGMTEKPPEGYNRWWEDYGFDSQEDFENSELFPGGMANMVGKLHQKPDADFWDDEATFVPLEENPDDPDHNANLLKVLESSAKRREAADEAAALAAERAPPPRFGVANGAAFDDDVNDLQGELADELATLDALGEALDAAVPDEATNGATRSEPPTLSASDLPEGEDLAAEVEDATALFDEEDYPSVGENRTDIAGTGVSDADMEALDRSWKRITETTGKEPWNKVASMGVDFDYDAYPKQYHYDMQETAAEIGSASYNIYPWLKYDMGFNVSNLILASIKHNPDAPVILQHWYPQLMICERYQHARDRNFDFTWEDVDDADLDELRTYYLGFGYDEIPSKAPSETGLISLEDADEQEVKMAAMEKWMLDVYNGEWDRKDFDDDTIKDEDNVFSDNFRMPQHPDLPAWEDAQEDIAGWKAEFDDPDEAENGDTDEAKRYRDFMGRSIDYEPVEDNESFSKNFRGHLVVACGNFDADLDVAESITDRMEQEFGNVIYTETKIYQHATKGDNLFEVWLESYEIDLLHSKRRAFNGVEGWEGTGEMTTDRLDHLVGEIRQLTSEDARTSFRWTEEQVS